MADDGAGVASALLRLPPCIDTMVARSTTRDARLPNVVDARIKVQRSGGKQSR